jgi:Xaa-Pro dipeptidase
VSLTRLREWMAGAGAGAAWVSDPVSIFYLTGFRANPHERLMALAARADGETVLVVPDLERENAEGRVRGVRVVSWRDGADPYRVLIDALGDVEVLAVEKEHLTIARLEGIEAERVVDASPALRSFRAVKEPGELELLAEAARQTDRATEAIMAELRPGLTEREVAGRLTALIEQAGASLSFPPLVQSGPNSALPHLGPSERRLVAGDLVLLDFGARHRGYNADTTRMAVIGKPDSEQVKVHQAVLDAHDRAVEAIRAGVAAGDVDAAARQSLERAGYGERFIHRTGHGLGLDAHELPNLEPGSSVRLEAGNVVTVEPGVYVPGWGGVRIEDDVVVEAQGARTLTAADRGLMVIAAGRSRRSAR